MINVSVIYAHPDRQIEIALLIEENCTIAVAVQRSGILQQFPEIVIGRTPLGIFGCRAAWDDLLKENDRIEIYRPLQIDPKQARVLRTKVKKI